MSIDRRKDKINGPTKPLMPRLAATTTPVRNGPSPRLAGYNPPAANSTPTRRPLSTNDANSPCPRPSETKATPPPRAIVSPNITPRSSARRLRAVSAQSTPKGQADGTTGIPRPTSLLSQDPLSSTPSSPYEDGTYPKPKRKRKETQNAGAVASSNFPFSFSAERPRVPILGNPRSLKQSGGAGGAGGARDAEAQPLPSLRPTLHQKKSSFAYANGDESLSQRTLEPSLAVVPHGGSETLPVSSPRDLQASRTDLETYSSRPGSPTKPLSPTAVSLPSRNMLLPGSSPPRDGFHLSYRKGVSQIIRPSPLSPHQEASQRNISLDSTSSRRHSRDLSSSSLESSPSKQQGLTSPRHANGFPQLSTRFNLPTPKASPIVSPTNGAPSPRNSFIHPLDVSLIDRVQSPTSTILSRDSDSGIGGSNRSDAATGARRERKILDLQISNSSLLAINRSLEKEMRRQKAELRRYKRATRNLTRQSLASERRATRSSRLPVLGEEDEENDHDQELEEDSEYSSASDESAEDENDADQDADGVAPHTHHRHRNRLTLDLSKHKALLADSTALNQSLKRCLGASEMMIKDGKRALEYRVPSPEAKVGGRVLSPEELEPSLIEDEAVGYFGIGRVSGMASVPETAADDGDDYEDANKVVDASDDETFDPGIEDSADTGALEVVKDGSIASDDQLFDPDDNTVDIDDAPPSPPLSPAQLPLHRFRSASSLLSRPSSQSASGATSTLGVPTVPGVLHSMPSLD